MPPINDCRAPLAGDSVDGSLRMHRNCNSFGKHRHFAPSFRAKCSCKPDTHCDRDRPAAGKSFHRGCRSAARARHHCHSDRQRRGRERTRHSALDVVDRVTAAVEIAMVARRSFRILERRHEGSDHRQRKAVADSDFGDTFPSAAGHRLARTGSSRTRSVRAHHRRPVADTVGARSRTNQHHSGAEWAGRRFPESTQLTIVTAAEPDASY